MEAQKHSFRITPDAPWDFVKPQRRVIVTPRLFIQYFGTPSKDNDSEGLGTYVFTSIDGAVVTVYQRAYDAWPLFIYLYRWIFWRGEKPVELTVASEQTQHAEMFCQWLTTCFPVEVLPR